MTDEQILQTLQLAGSSEAVQRQALINVHTIAESRLVLLLDEILTPEQRTQFNELQAARDNRAAAWFLEQFPQLQELYDSIIAEVVGDPRYHPKV